MVELRDEAAVAARVCFATGGHEIGPSKRRAGTQTTAPIVVGEGGWIGMGCTILGGVTVGAGAIVAAGSVVTQDCEPNALYAGVPATLKRYLTD